MSQQLFCLDCRMTCELTIHGFCQKCGSAAVMLQEDLIAPESTSWAWANPPRPIESMKCYRAVGKGKQHETYWRLMC